MQNLITKEQCDAIISRIQHQCMLMQHIERNNMEQFTELYDPDYFKGRKHSITAGILSGFKEGDEFIPGITISKIKYGGNHYQPELRNDSAIIQIYSFDNDLKNQDVITKCRQFNHTNSSLEFAIIRFDIGEGFVLNKVQLLRFDSDALRLGDYMLFNSKTSKLSTF